MVAEYASDPKVTLTRKAVLFGVATLFVHLCSVFTPWLIAEPGMDYDVYARRSKVALLVIGLAANVIALVGVVVCFVATRRKERGARLTFAWVANVIGLCLSPIFTLE